MNPGFGAAIGDSAIAGDEDLQLPAVMMRRTMIVEAEQNGLRPEADLAAPDWPAL